MVQRPPRLRDREFDLSTSSAPGRRHRQRGDRLLACSPCAADSCAHRLAALRTRIACDAPLEEFALLARRGPAQAACTTPSCGNSASSRCRRDRRPEDLELDPVQAWLGRGGEPRPCVEICASCASTRLASRGEANASCSDFSHHRRDRGRRTGRAGRRRAHPARASRDGSLAARAHGPAPDLDAGLVLRSIGYQRDRDPGVAVRRARRQSRMSRAGWSTASIT